MEDFVYKFATKKYNRKEGSDVHNFRALYYYVKNVGLTRYASVSKAAFAHGLKATSVSRSATKSSSQTYEEFISDNAVNKFIYTDDEKANRLIEEFGLL